MAEQIISIVIGLYLLGESIAAASLMEGGDKISRLSKYLLVSIIGLWLIFESKHADAFHLVMAVALALFLWPKMLKRIDHFIYFHIGD